MRVRTALLSNILVVAAVVLFINGVVISLHDQHGNQVADQQAARLIKAASHSTQHSIPSTTKPQPSAFASYTVAANLPRYIFIPKLSVQAIVEPLGLTAAGQLATPDNVYDTGWYTRSSTPGQPGATVIDGHVSSWTANGVFYGLQNLQAGDTIRIERGDGTTINYSVVKKQVYDYRQVNMAAVLLPVNAAKPGLNLITCTGTVIKGTNDFNERVVVFAVET